MFIDPFGIECSYVSCTYDDEEEEKDVFNPLA